MEKNKIAVIGAGSFGTSLAMLLTGKGHEVCLWGRKEALVELMRETGENPHYLPGVRLPEELKVTGDMGKALKNAEIALFAVPAQSFRQVYQEASGYMGDDTVTVNVAKVQVTPTPSPEPTPSPTPEPTPSPTPEPTPTSDDTTTGQDSVVLP